MSETFHLQESDAPGDGEKRAFVTIPEGEILEVEVTKVQKAVKPFKDDDGNPVVKVEFTFSVVDDNYNGRLLWGETPTTFTTHPDCKLRSWVQEILAVTELPPGFEFNTDTIIGSRARAVVAIREYPDKQTGEIKQRNYVSDVIRSRDAISVGSGLADAEPF